MTFWGVAPAHHAPGPLPDSAVTVSICDSCSTQTVALTAVCTECETAFAGPSDFEMHLRASGHSSVMPDLLLRPIVELLAHPGVLGGRGIVYETDDDVLSYPDWTGLGSSARRERDLIERPIWLRRQRRSWPSAWRRTLGASFE